MFEAFFASLAALFARAPIFARPKSEKCSKHAENHTRENLKSSTLFSGKYVI